MKSVWALALVGICGCTSPNPTKHCAEGMCVNQDFPYCDVEGVISGEAGTCISVTCTPTVVEKCVGDVALTCNANGDGYDRVPCELGCGDTPKPHCRYIEPRYIPDACDTPASDEELRISSSGTLDPNLDSNCNGGVVAQEGAPAICVVRYRRISISAGAVLKVTGRRNVSDGRPVALIADDELAIEGTLDISADGVVNGPGGGVTTSGGQPLVTNATTHIAGGGAGGKTAGAPGGSASADGGAANGGQAMLEPALLAALVGGSAGYRTASTSSDVASGGGGGGIALASCRGSVVVSGVIDAGGGGGAPGIYLSFPGVGLPGNGGGAGGNVVLAGVRVSVTGQIFANGGGGGGGMQSSQLNGIAGNDGSSSATAPGTGGSPQDGEGKGGAGGFGSTVPGSGGAPTTNFATAGGGGGSVGFLQTYTPAGIEPMLSPSAVSPAFQSNRTIMTR